MNGIYLGWKEIFLSTDTAITLPCIPSLTAAAQDAQKCKGKTRGRPVRHGGRQEAEAGSRNTSEGAVVHFCCTFLWNFTKASHTNVPLKLQT